MDHQELVKLVLSEAAHNRRLRDKLEFEEACSVGPDLAVFKKIVTEATRTSGIDYNSMPRFADRLLEVIDSIRGLLAGGHAKAVVTLTEYTFTRLEKTIGRVDDSDGYFGKIVPALTEVHHEACVMAREEPLGLARRLFAFEMSSEWDLFSGAARVYEDVLGEPGLFEYRRLAEEAWSRVPPLKPGDGDSDRYGRRFRITSIMETLARQSGDLETLTAVKQRDLSHPYSFLQIAELYREIGQHDLALQWAEQGAYAFEHCDSRLSNFLAEEYHRRGRHGNAMTLIWEQFVERPGLEMYQRLHENALLVKSPREHLRLVGKNEEPNTRVDSAPPTNDEWQDWRTEALRFLRERVDNSDRSRLVEIFFWERNYEMAWKEATAGGCSTSLWLQLADQFASEEPARAYLVYQELIAPTLSGTNNAAYSEAITLLKKMRKLTSRLKCESDFSDYLVALRVEYKRKRNFIQMLDKLQQQASNL
jgi:hypothetical protein